MATLTSFSANIFMKNPMERAFLFSGSLSSSPSNVCFSRSRNFSLHLNDSFSVFQNGRIGPVPVLNLTLNPVTEQVSVGLENAGGELEMQRKCKSLVLHQKPNQTVNHDKTEPTKCICFLFFLLFAQLSFLFPPVSSKTMHVQFQLQKKCKFGEQFLLVGNDPMLGSWNPTDAIPLNWSDGHVWTAEMDIPVGLAIQFKFILKSREGEIIWRPGPDRFFRASEDDNTIIVSEDWDKADFQRLAEQEKTDRMSEHELNQDSETSEQNLVFISNSEFIDANMRTEEEEEEEEKKKTQSMFVYEGGHVLVSDLASQVTIVAANEAVPDELIDFPKNDMFIGANAAED